MIARIACVVALAGCADDPLTLAEVPCPEAGTALTYDNFGAEFFTLNCNRCHSTGANGAPRAFRFDTGDEIRLHAERIFVRAAGPNTSMPPGPDDPSQKERDQLAEWLACGAP